MVWVQPGGAHGICFHSPGQRATDPALHAHAHVNALQSKTGTEAMSVSTDGSVLWWDIRKLSEAVESMPLKEKGSETSLGGVILEYDPAAGPTNFMVGTEQVRCRSCGAPVAPLVQWVQVTGGR